MTPSPPSFPKGDPLSAVNVHQSNYRQYALVQVNLDGEDGRHARISTVAIFATSPQSGFKHEIPQTITSTPYEDASRYAWSIARGLRLAVTGAFVDDSPCAVCSSLARSLSDADPAESRYHRIQQTLRDHAVERHGA